MNIETKRLDRHEKEFILRMLEGERNRICVSDDPIEIIRMIAFAVENLSRLAVDRVLRILEGDE